MCDCENCLDSENPCSGDCDRDEYACQGCKDARDEQDEIQFEIDCAQGSI